jgi:hypothetical protein
MKANLSVAEILASLESQMAFDKEREAHHAEREAFHREQRAQHAARYEAVAKSYEAFKATAGAAVEIAAQSSLPVPAPEPPPVEEAAPPLRPVDRARLIARVVDELPAGEVFGPSRLAEEANRRYGRQLGQLVEVRTASGILRRLLADGAVRLVRKGGSHREALYGRD